MPKFANENAYDTLIAKAVAKHGSVVTVPLVKAIIGVESAFRPKAFRNEPKVNDASRGLMQILYKTAKSVGFTGEPGDLLTPSINIDYGVKFLSSLVRSKNNDVLAAVSAYNNGNGKRAKVVTPVCLARDQVTGKCVRTHIAKPGEFFNQPYVDKVLALVPYFGGETPKPKGGMNALGAIIFLAFVLADKWRGLQ